MGVTCTGRVVATGLTDGAFIDNGTGRCCCCCCGCETAFINGGGRGSTKSCCCCCCMARARADDVASTEDIVVAVLPVPLLLPLQPCGTEQAFVITDGCIAPDKIAMNATLTAKTMNTSNRTKNTSNGVNMVTHVLSLFFLPCLYMHRQTLYLLHPDGENYFKIGRSRVSVASFSTREEQANFICRGDRSCVIILLHMDTTHTVKINIVHKEETFVRPLRKRLPTPTMMVRPKEGVVHHCRREYHAARSRCGDSVAKNRSQAQ